MQAAVYALAAQALDALKQIETGKWEIRASLPEAKENFAAASLDGEKVLAIAGTSSKTVFRYDYTLNTWTQRADQPNNARYPAAAYLDNGRVLSTGGFHTGTSNAAYRYTDATNSWTTRANMSIPRQEHAAASLSGSRVFVVGGYDGSSSRSSAEVYTDSSNTWTTRADMPQTARAPLAASLSGDKVLVTYIRSVYRYDYNTNSWTKRADLPTTFSLTGDEASAVALSNDRVLIAGISLPSGASYTICYDDALNAWAYRAAMGINRVGVKAAALAGDKALFIGGKVLGQSYPSTVVECFYDKTPAANTLIQALSAIQALAIANL